MPSLLLTNTNRLVNKLDELSILCHSVHPAIIAITETWLTSDISDNHIHISDSDINYVIYRRDRVERTGGGVLIYVRDDIQSFKLSFLESDRHEIVFVALRPKILPRPFGILVICLLYCPPWYGTDLKTDLTNYVTDSVDKITAKYPGAAFILCGDLNSLHTNFITSRLHFKQVTSSGTRGSNILDKIFLNCNRFYLPAVEILPPLGKSDHNCVLLKPVSRERLPAAGWKVVRKRSINDYTINRLGSKLATVDWRPLFFSNDVQFQCNYFYSKVNLLLDENMPVTERRFKNSDKPWITSYFKKSSFST